MMANLGESSTVANTDVGFRTTGGNIAPRGKLEERNETVCRLIRVVEAIGATRENETRGTI